MAFTRTWNASYEASPADATDDVGDGAGDIRKFKVDVRERLAVDHYMDTAGTDADHGEHKFVTLREQASITSPGASKGRLALKSTGLFINIAGTEFQISSLTGLANSSIPSGEIILFEKDTVVTGYTLLTDIDDKLVFISKGSGAGGEDGASNHSTGTWTQPNHTHAVAGTTGNGSAAVERNGGDEVNVTTVAHTHTVSITSGDGAPANTWRPACRVFTRQQRS